MSHSAPKKAALALDAAANANVLADQIAKKAAVDSKRIAAYEAVQANIRRQ
jgi:hypothetical protein